MKALYKLKYSNIKVKGTSLGSLWSLQASYLNTSPHDTNKLLELLVQVYIWQPVASKCDPYLFGFLGLSSNPLSLQFELSSLRDVVSWNARDCHCRRVTTGEPDSRETDSWGVNTENISSNSGLEKKKSVSFQTHVEQKLLQFE